MTEEYLSSNQGLQKKFQEWFGDPVSPDLPCPTDVDHLSEVSVPLSISFPVESNSPSDVPVPPKNSYPTVTAHSRNNTRRSFFSHLRRLSALIKFGFVGAVSLGTFVSFIILIMYFSSFRWYIDDWLNQIFTILFAVVIIGFLIGMYIGSIYKDDLGVA